MQIILPLQILFFSAKETTNEGSVRKWCQFINKSRTNIHDKLYSGHPSLITQELKGQIDKHTKENWSFTFHELSEKFLMLSQLLLHEVIIVHLNYWEICAWWVPQILTKVHKNNGYLLLWMFWAMKQRAFWWKRWWQNTRPHFDWVWNMGLIYYT